MKYAGLSVSCQTAIVGLSILLSSCQAMSYRQERKTELPASGEKGSRYLYRYYDPDAGCFGYMDKKGKVVISPQFDGGQRIFSRLGSVQIKGKDCFIDRSGKPLIFLVEEDDSAEPEEGEQQDRPELPEFQIKPFQMSKKEEVIIIRVDSDHGSYSPLSSEGLVYIKSRNHWAFIDASGKIVIGPFSEDEITLESGFSEGLTKVSKKIRVGDEENWIDAYMNRRGDIVIEYDGAVGVFHDGLALIRQNRRYGYIDKAGRVAIEPKFGYASNFWRGTAVVGTRVLDNPVRAGAWFSSDYPIDRNCGDEQDFTLINKNGRILKRLGRIPPGWEIDGGFSEGLVAVNVPSEFGVYRRGFIDNNLNLVIRPQFYYEPDYLVRWGNSCKFDDGIAEVRNYDTGLSGYINRKGEWVRSWGEPRDLTFVFREASPDDVLRTLNSIGAVPNNGSHREWIYPSQEQILLEIYLKDQKWRRDFEIECIYPVVEMLEKLESAALGASQSGKGSSPPIGLGVSVAYGTAAEEALNKFALLVLKDHPGGAYDFNGNQVWTLEEIRSNANSQGVPFMRRLEKPTVPSLK